MPVTTPKRSTLLSLLDYDEDDDAGAAHVIATAERLAPKLLANCGVGLHNNTDGGQYDLLTIVQEHLLDAEDRQKFEDFETSLEQKTHQDPSAAAMDICLMHVEAAYLLGLVMGVRFAGGVR